MASEKLNIPIQGPGQVAPANTSGMGRAIAEAGGMLLDTAAGVMSRKAAAKGTQDAIDGTVRGGGIWSSMDSYKRAAAQTRFTILETQSIETLRGYEQDFSRDTAEYKKLSDAHIAGQVAELMKLDPRRALELKSRLTHMQLDSAARIDRNVLQDTRERSVATFAKAQETAMKEWDAVAPSMMSDDLAIAGNALELGAKTYMRLEEMWATPDPGGEGNLFSDIEVEKSRQSTVRKMQQSMLQAYVLSLKNPGDFAESILQGQFQMPEIDAIPGFGQLSQDMAIDIARFARSEQSHIDAANREVGETMKASAGMKFKNMAAEIQDRGYTTLDFSAEEVPFVSADMVAELEHQKATYSAQQELAGLGIVEGQRYATTLPVTGEDAVFELERKRALITEAVKREQEFRSDSAEFVFSKNRVVRLAMLNAENGTLPFEEVITRSLEQQQHLGEGLIGFQPRVLSKLQAVEIANTVDAFESGQEQQVVGFVGALRDKYKSHFDRAIQDAVELGQLNPLVGVLSEYPSQSVSARNAVAGMLVGDDKLNSLIPKDIDVRQAIDIPIQDAFEPFFQTFPPMHGAKKEAYRQFATLAVKNAYIDRGVNTGRGFNDIIRDVYEDMVGAHYKLEDSVRIPVREADWTVRRGLRLKSQVLDKFADQISLEQSGFNATASGSLHMRDIPDVKKQYIRALESGGYFVTNEDETGVELNDAQGAPVILQNGQHLTLSWQDLRNITSPASALMTVLPYAPAK